MFRTPFFLAALFVFASTAGHAADKKDSLAALEQKLHGQWKGGPCQGNWTFRDDGTFSAEHYSPGGNKLAGTWSVRWDALPPTLVRTCKTSDDADLMNKSWEVRLIELTDDLAVMRFGVGHDFRFTRMTEEDNAEMEKARKDR